MGAQSKLGKIQAPSRSIQSHGRPMTSDDNFAHNYISEEKGTCSLATFNPTEPHGKPTTSIQYMHIARRDNTPFSRPTFSFHMNVFEPSTNKVAGVFKLAFVICLSLVAKTADACGDGSSTSVVAGSVLRCCSTTHDATGYKYSVDGGTHDDNIKFTVENDEGTVILDTGGNCDITQSGTRCSGTACTSSNNNNCERGPITSGIEAQKICVVIIMKFIQFIIL